ncbi:hypothetical protein B296_00049242 [Ensete ventricosum]|uniref:Uncharacterized protein n=1 Tax=Ensete ventricosum TaxID=4639 RepID=A0A426WZV1_ENSVE|nr:hypothetical protein B296_00049242 [Ensete ventricosum]
MACTIPASAWTWLVRPRKASTVTTNGAGLDAGKGNLGSVIILQKRLGVSTATTASSVGPCALVHPRSSRDRVGARSDGRIPCILPRRSATGVVELGLGGGTSARVGRWLLQGGRVG